MKAVTKHRLAKRVVPLALLAVVSLAAWFGPGLMGAPSSLDAWVILAWLLVMVALLADSYRRERKCKQFLSTFYIDTAGKRVFSPSLGLVSYPNGAALIDTMAVALANADDRTHIEPPSDFKPDYVVETADFSFVKDERLPQGEPVDRADDVTIHRWEGVISQLDAGKDRSFMSPFDLEDVFNPRTAPAAGGGGSRNLADGMRPSQFQPNDPVYAMTDRMA